MDDILGLGKPIDADAVRQVKAWVRDAGRFDESATMLVSELHCHEPGCPDVETIVAVMRPGHPRLQIRFDVPISDLTSKIVESRVRLELDRKA